MNGGFAPPLPAPGASYPIIYTPSTNQQRNQCEGVGGRYVENCQQAGQMMPGFAYTPGLPAGLPAALALPPCIGYCTMPSGSESTYDTRTGSWNPPLTALQGLSGVEGMAEGLFWKATKSAVAGFAAFMVLRAAGKQSSTSKMVGWVAAGATFLFL